MRSAKQVARECGTKVRYPTFEAAMASSRQLQHKSREAMTAYRCRFCREYHVGHTPGVRRSGR